jgi:hypothetical protein
MQAAISLPIICRVGAPGGCPTCNLYVVEINSPGSHQLAVGSRVSIKTVAAIANTIHPMRLFSFLYCVM